MRVEQRPAGTCIPWQGSLQSAAALRADRLLGRQAGLPAHCGILRLQGMYVSMTYHSYNIAYGGDKSVDNLDGWVDNWVTLLTAVLKSDVCKVNRALLQSVASWLHLSA